MIRVWRLCRRAFIDTAFDGEGARRYGGRWNPPGRPLVYTAEALALAALEILVQVDLDLAPDNFVAIPAILPDQLPIHELTEADLPEDWQDQYPPVTTQATGERWLKGKEGVALRVPSTVVPSEHNFLLNPLHADFAHIRIEEPRPFHFDRRLWRA